MEFIQQTDPALFFKNVKAILLQEEAINNLPLGILGRLSLSQPTTELESSPFMAYYKKTEDTISLILLMTPPHHLIVCGGPIDSSEMELVVDDLIARRLDLPSVIGSPRLVEPFASFYSQKTHFKAEIEMNQRVYQLDQVTSPQKSEGNFRRAEAKEQEILGKWIFAFTSEAVEEPVTKEWARDRASRGIQEKTLYVWEKDGQTVSMASASRPTENGITISLVYTPPEQRKKGYASKCVAALCQHLLDQGYQFCSLYTDLSNPTSNKIYQEIGFYPVDDSIVIRFNK